MVLTKERNQTDSDTPKLFLDDLKLNFPNPSVGGKTEIKNMTITLQTKYDSTNSLLFPIKVNTNKPNRRTDVYGIEITKEKRKHKISFIDTVSENETKFAEEILVISFKKYNTNSSALLKYKQYTLPGDKCECSCSIM